MVDVTNICSKTGISTFSDYQLQLLSFIFLLSYTHPDSSLLQLRRVAEFKPRKYKLCLIDIVVNVIVLMFTTQWDGWP
jgi:hypothetical protein